MRARDGAPARRRGSEGRSGEAELKGQRLELRTRTTYRPERVQPDRRGPRPPRARGIWGSIQRERTATFPTRCRTCGGSGAREPRGGGAVEGVRGDRTPACALSLERLGKDGRVLGGLGWCQRWRNVSAMERRARLQFIPAGCTPNSGVRRPPATGRVSQPPRLAALTDRGGVDVTAEERLVEGETDAVGLHANQRQACPARARKRIYDFRTRVHYGEASTLQ